MILSILTPAVPARFEQLQQLCHRIADQIRDQPVEHLVLVDNKQRTIGGKRDALLRIAKGEYVAFVDDDDNISEDYVGSILEAARTQPDVITFRQSVSYCGQVGEVEFRLGNPNETFAPNGMTRRNAWHVCAWRRTLAILSHFPEINYGEDWAFASKLCALKDLKEVHIPKVLHHYFHDPGTTEAPANFNSHAIQGAQ